MLKFILYFAAMVWLVGCVVQDTATLTGGISNTNERCMNGVVYYSGVHAMTPAFKQDGSLYLC